MNTDYLQALRYKLQRRCRRLNSTRYQLFHFGLRQFWGFLCSEPLFQGILENLEREATPTQSMADNVISARQAVLFDTEHEQVVASYLVLKSCVASDNQLMEVTIGRQYNGETRHDDALEGFRDAFLEPFYDYLDEALDETALRLSLLNRYKKRCEWFHRDQLFELWSGDTRRGEHRLALDLYEYLFEQGINFQIEPRSASGEVDLISSQTGEEPLLADAKIFNPERGKGKAYVIGGFNQIYTYTLDYNETFAFLVIFKTCEEALHFALPDKTGPTPFFTHNGKTLFFIVIDVYPYEESASKRGQLQSVEISASELVARIEETVNDPTLRERP